MGVYRLNRLRRLFGRNQRLSAHCKACDHSADINIAGLPITKDIFSLSSKFKCSVCGSKDIELLATTV